MTNKIKIKTPFIELDSFLKYANICMSGGEAKIKIQNNEILVNGEVCSMRKKKLFPGDEVEAEQKKYTVV